MLIADETLARRLESIEVAILLDAVEAKLLIDPKAMAMADPVAGGYAAYLGAKSRMNRAVGLGLNGPVESEDVDHLDEFFHGHGVASRVDLCPLAHPSLLEQLNQHEYRPASFQNLLVLALSNEGGYPKTFPDVEIRLVKPAEQELWTRTVAEAAREEEDPQTDPADLAAILFHSKHTTCHLAWSDGRPVGAGAMALHGETAMLHPAAVFPGESGRNVLKALLRFQLGEAVAAGCGLAILTTLPGSSRQRIAEHAGFRTVYTRLVLRHGAR